MRRLVDHEPNKHNIDTDHIDCNERDSQPGYHNYTEDDYSTYLEWIKHEETSNPRTRHPDFLPSLFTLWDNYNWTTGTFRPTDANDDQNNSPDQILDDTDVAELLNVIRNQDKNGQVNPYHEWLTKQENEMCINGTKAFHNELKKSTDRHGDTDKLGELFIE